MLLSVNCRPVFANDMYSIQYFLISTSRLVSEPGAKNSRVPEMVNRLYGNLSCKFNGFLLG
jgi:hypothetical protein